MHSLMVSAASTATGRISGVSRAVTLCLAESDRERQTSQSRFSHSRSLTLCPWHLHDTEQSDPIAATRVDLLHELCAVVRGGEPVSEFRC
jgi:hypothetical protein